MNVALLPMAGFPARSGDRALSKEGQQLRYWLAAILDFTNSVAVGEPKRLARESLNAAWLAADTVSVEPSTYFYADQVLSLIPRTIIPPEIVVDNDGEILLEWDKGPRHVLSISVGRDGTLSYAGLFGLNKLHGTEILRDALPLAISNCLKLFSAETEGHADS